MIFRIGLGITVFFQLIVFNTNLLSAQGSIDENKSLLFSNERTIAISLRSNGFGGDFRYGQFIQADKKWLIHASLNYIRDAKEVKSVSYINQNQSFVYGKLNSFYTLHVGSGYQKELFSKFDKGGVAIRYFFVGGPSFGFVKPKYYEVTYFDGKLQIEDFESFLENSINFHGGAIYGNASFLEGIKKTKLAPGVYGLLGFNFDYATSNDFYNAIEAGMVVDFFVDDIQIMYNENNSCHQLFISLFLNYRFGKVYSSR